MDANVSVPDGGLPSTRPPQPRLPEADADVELPFRGEAQYSFELEADLGRMDVHFSIDTTASIGAEIDKLQSQLEGEVIPRLRRRVPDIAFGVSRFEDFPIEPFGRVAPADNRDGRADTPFELLTPITDSRSRLRRAMAELDDPLGFGGDGPEAGAEALYQIATGEGISLEGARLVPAFDAERQDAPGSIGGVGFRPGALPVVVHVTDAPTHAEDAPQDPHAHSLADAIEALKAINARVIGVASGACPDCDPPTDASFARGYLRRAAYATGAVTALLGDGCPMGIGGRDIAPYRGTCPLVYEVDAEGDGLPRTVTDGVVALLDGIRFGVVEANASADPLGLVAGIEVAASGEGPGPELVDRDPQGVPDGLPDTALDVSNRTTLRYRVHLRNDVVAPRDRDQQFRVMITIRGDGLVVDERVLRVRVPAAAADAAVAWSEAAAGR